MSFLKKLFGAPEVKQPRPNQDQVSDLASKSEAFSIADGYSYARDRLRSHMRMSSGAEKTMEILDDVIRVIDEYSYGADRIVSAWDFIELTQYLSDTRNQGLREVKVAVRETKMMRPILAGLKKLVLVRDCGVDEKAIPNDVDQILRLDGPREVDEVVKYLFGVGLG
jgi:hypothetical protein